MFQITEFTEARLASITNRVEKHGDDDKPAVSLGIELTTANTILDTIDPTIRQALFKPVPAETPELPGLEESTPVLRCNSIDRVVLPTSHDGWTLELDDGIDDTDPMTFGRLQSRQVQRRAEARRQHRAAVSHRHQRCGCGEARPARHAQRPGHLDPAAQAREG